MLVTLGGGVVEHGLRLRAKTLWRRNMLQQREKRRVHACSLRSAQVSWAARSRVTDCIAALSPSLGCRRPFTFSESSLACRNSTFALRH